MKGLCEFCGAEVEKWQTAAYPVTGWEAERAKGGANQIHGRQRVPGRVAHTSCLERQLALQRQGIHPGQGRLA